MSSTMMMIVARMSLAFVLGVLVGRYWRAAIDRPSQRRIES